MAAKPRAIVDGTHPPKMQSANKNSFFAGLELLKISLTGFFLLALTWLYIIAKLLLTGLAAVNMEVSISPSFSGTRTPLARTDGGLGQIASALRYIPYHFLRTA